MQCLKKNVEGEKSRIQELEDSNIMNESIIKNANAQLKDMRVVQCKEGEDDHKEK